MKKIYHSKFNKEEKIAILLPAFEKLGLMQNDININKRGNSYYFSYNNINYRASLHNTPEWMQDTINYDISIVSNSYPNLANRILELNK